MSVFFDKIAFFISSFWDVFRHILDVAAVGFIFYLIYNFLNKTRAIQLLKGFLIIFSLALASRFLKLQTLEWLTKDITTQIIVMVTILFQPELRRLITQFGQRNWISSDVTKAAFPLDELVSAVFSMAEEKIGSLIVVERNTGLKSYVESGVLVDATITEEFIRTIFFPLTPLHDGAIIIQEGRIASAACYLPLSDSKQLRKQHGARHRAALGIAEESDALVIVSSEENGSISIMVNGKMYSRVKDADVKNMILFYMNPKTAYEEFKGS